MKLNEKRRAYGKTAVLQPQCTACYQPITPNQLTCPICGTLNPNHMLPGGLPSWFQQPRIPHQRLAQSNIPISHSHYLAVGGGLGSFAWVNHLRVHGVAASDIAVISRQAAPYGRFRQLCRHSQIRDSDRIRSDSSSRPDNLWGWPGYALEEIADCLRQGAWYRAGRLAWQIFSEPALADTYAPRAKAVFRGLEREEARIGWPEMLRLGEVCAIRQTDNGRYLIAYLPQNSQTPHFHLTTYLHLSLGYAGINLTPELQAYRDQTEDWQRAVQAYEPHEHIYEQLAQRGGLLLLRGRGIVAARILQRLDEIRRTTGQDIRVIHLLRTPLTEDTYYGQARRQTRHHWQWQPFNWPKAAFGGDLRLIMEQAAPAERQALLATWGGTTAGDQQAWQQTIAAGMAAGWYQLYFGQVSQIRPNGRFRLITTLHDYEPPHTQRRFVTDFMIDCTGLDADLHDQPLLADLQQRYHLPQNQSGQLITSQQFELKSFRNGEAQTFVSGINAFGNQFAPVDSFLGLQFAAQCAIKQLLAEGAPGLQPLRGIDSLRQWWRWWRNQPPQEKEPYR